MNEPAPSSVPHASPCSAHSPCCGGHGEPPRRGFLVQFLAGACGALAGLIPAVTGGLFFLDPLLRRKKSTGAEPGGVEKDADGYIRMQVTVNALPVDGTPQQFKVIDDIINVWNKIPQQPVGAVWLRNVNGQVIAFNTVCPHLGCAVEHRPAEGDFYCPCHLSAFSLDGQKKNPIPPRGMDTLEVRQSGQEIWVKFQNFRAASPDKVPV